MVPKSKEYDAVMNSFESLEEREQENFIDEIIDSLSDSDIFDEADRRGYEPEYELDSFSDEQIYQEFEVRGLKTPSPGDPDMLITYIRMGNRKEAIHELVKMVPELKYHEEFLLG